MKRYIIRAAVLLVSMTTSVQTLCNNVTTGRDDGGSCRFRDSGICGWMNIKGDDLDWQFKDYNGIGTNSYMRLPMANATSGDTGLFGSPFLCATGSGLQSLRFRYAIERSNRCRLSVHLVNWANSTEVWSTQKGTGTFFSSKTDPILFRCPGGSFQIVFVGKKLGNSNCGRIYNEIGLDTIEYTSLGPSDKSGFQCPVPRVTTTTPASTSISSSTSTSTSTSMSASTTTHADQTTYVSGPTATPEMPTTSPKSNSQADTDDGLSGGAVAGVVIVVLLVIIAILIVIAVLFLRRRRAKQLQKTGSTGPIKQTMSITNSVYMVHNSPHRAVHHPSDTGRSNITASTCTGTSSSQAGTNRLSSPHYDVVSDSPPSVSLRPSAPPYYDTPRQSGATSPDAHYSSPTSSPAYYSSPTASGADYPTPSNRDSETYEAVAVENEYSVARDSECYSLATQPDAGCYYSMERSSGKDGGVGSLQPSLPPSFIEEGYSLAQNVDSKPAAAGAAAATKPVKPPREQKKPDSSESEYVNMQVNRGGHDGGSCYNRLALGAVGSRTSLEGSSGNLRAETAVYSNDLHGDGYDPYDHLSHDEDDGEVAQGDAVYRNIDFP